MATNLTAQAIEGYSATDCKSPYLSTSNSDSAWHIGNVFPMIVTENAAVQS